MRLLLARGYFRHFFKPLFLKRLFRKAHGKFENGKGRGVNQGVSKALFIEAQL
jgi:hypothetical protein